MSSEGCDVQGAPPVARGQPGVSPELHEEFHELQVARDDRAMKSRLTLGAEKRVHVELFAGTGRGVLQKGLELAGVTSTHRLLEDALVRGGGRAGGHLSLAHGRHGHPTRVRVWALSLTSPTVVG